MRNKLFFYLQAGFYLFAGSYHFINPDFYLPLIPEYIPFPDIVNTVSGVLEVLLGFLLLFAASRKYAAWGIILMLLAFIPSHVYFIQQGSCLENGLCTEPWVGWLRLVIIHPLLILWAWWAGYRYKPKKN